MRDWKIMAKASGLDLPYPELERLVAPLEKLEETFRAALRGLPSSVEPASILPAEDDAE
jgi:hypothetical protein